MPLSHDNWLLYEPEDDDDDDEDDEDDEDEEDEANDRLKYGAGIL